MKRIFRNAFYSPHADEDEKNYLQMNDVEELFQTAELELGISRNVLNFSQHTVSIHNKPSDCNDGLVGDTARPRPKISSDVPGIEAIEEMLTSLPNTIQQSWRK
uniref:Uncharacterized protein n=1 Tax=Anopheles merus TaxID=30066 RepID=A0A182V2Y2_ANOME